jgi:hypothetical protein
MKALAFDNLSLTTCAAAIAFASVAAGCSDSDEQREGNDVNGAYQELATQLQNCASDALDCYGAANCDDAREATCRDEFQVCRENTRAAYRAYHEAVHECWAEKWACVSDAGFSDAGADARAACRDQLKACVAEDKPLPAPLGPCMQGLRDCVQSDAETGERPSVSLVHDCLIEAHGCVIDRFPMCGPGGPMPAAGSGGTMSAAGTSAGGASGAAGVAGVSGSGV